MQTATHTAEPLQTPVAPSIHVPQTLDELLDVPADELAALYRGASVPALSALNGDLRGRMLAWPAIKGPAARVVRALAGSSRFPWLGKSFEASSTDAGVGLNRVLLDRLKLFRFTTAVGRSRAGEFDAVQLDYDHPGNPFFIRAVKDEVRELRPGLFLGQAYALVRGKASLVLYFGLQS